MARPSPDTRDVLLSVLTLLERGPMATRAIAGERGLPAGAVRVVLEALEAEGLVERDGAVHHITEEGSEARRHHAPGSRVEQVTIVFTDVVGSTALLDRVGDVAAHELRRRHFALLRQVTREHDGREVKSLGDGLMLAFDSTRAAVACALSMQSAVAVGDDPLALRIGIAAGQTVREGDDYFGRPVILARRLCDAARGGDVVVSGSLHAVVADVGAIHELEALGPLVLKGLRQPVAASAVRARPLALSA
jgi:class 3 adenylate cyclase